MTALIHFQDSVTAANLPSNQEFGIFYTDGDFANESEVRARLPKAKRLLGITPSGKTGPDINLIDCERFDATPAQIPGWIEEQVKNMVDILGVYASTSRWAAGLWDEVQKFPHVKTYFADYNTPPNETLTIVYQGVTYHCDAHQYAGGDIPTDSNVALPSFFTAFKPKKNTGVTHFKGEVDLETGEGHIHHLMSPTAKYQIEETLKLDMSVTVKPGHHAEYALTKK